MIQFELENEWGGWDHAAIPDDMEITVRTADSDKRAEISLVALLELYGHVLHRKQCDIVIGTGDFIEIVRKNDRILFRTPPLDIQTTFEELEANLEPLIREVFKAKDDRTGVESRDEQLEYVQKKLEKKGIRYDLTVLYQRPTDEESERRR